MTEVVLVHDYLTQRGGAERVVLSMLKAFPEAPLYTSLYEPSTTYPEFQDVGVRPLALNRLAVLRKDHRRALPLLASAFSTSELPGDVLLCSSSGWAHGARAEGGRRLARVARQQDHAAVPGEQLADQSRADEAGAAGDEDGGARA